jgi:hypothetical protein
MLALRPLLVVVALVALGAAPGCPKPIDEVTDAGPTGPQLITCTDVSECPGFVEGAAQQQVRCDGVCLTICSGVDEVCPRGFFCDAAGVCDIGCRPGPGECAADELCVQGECRASSGQQCATKCDCQPGEVCTGGACLPAGNSCDTAADCPRGPADDCEAFSCNGFTDTCFDPSPTPCTAAVDCVGRPGCTGGAACTCTGNGACVPDVDCTAADENATCGAGNFCDGNGDCQALPACANDTECPAGLTCNEGAARCERPQACTIPADCTIPPTTFCEDNFCAIPNCNNGGTTCQANQDCSADGRCVAAGTGATCANDSACPNDQFCNFSLSPSQCSLGCRDDGFCPQGQVCNGARQCVTEGGGGNGGFGADCLDDSECQSNLLCGTFTFTCAEQCLLDPSCPLCTAANGSCTCNGLGFCQP